jgi:hypothetical protein
MVGKYLIAGCEDEDGTKPANRQLSISAVLKFGAFTKAWSVQ